MEIIRLDKNKMVVAQEMSNVHLVSILTIDLKRFMHIFDF